MQSELVFFLGVFGHIEGEMARWTRLELATPAVTGRYSNQLNYHRTVLSREYMVVASGLEPLASTL